MTQATKSSTWCNPKTKTLKSPARFFKEVVGVGWGSEDVQLDFIKQEENKNKEQNEFDLELKRKNDEIEAKRKKNLDRFKGSGKPLPSTLIKDVQKIEAIPVKFTNQKNGDGGNKFKKDLNAPVQTKTEVVQVEPETKAQISSEPIDFKIVKKDKKVLLGDTHEEKFAEEKRLAEEKKRHLELDFTEENQKIEDQKNKNSIVQRAADKFKPQTKHEDKPAQMGTVNKEAVKKEHVKEEEFKEIKKTDVQLIKKEQVKSVPVVETKKVMKTVVHGEKKKLVLNKKEKVSMVVSGVNFQKWEKE